MIEAASGVIAGWTNRIYLPVFYFLPRRLGFQFLRPPLWYDAVINPIVTSLNDGFNIAGEKKVISISTLSMRWAGGDLRTYRRYSPLDPSL
jgi:hypothetical protein